MAEQTDDQRAAGDDLLAVLDEVAARVGHTDPLWEQIAEARDGWRLATSNDDSDDDESLDSLMVRVTAWANADDIGIGEDVRSDARALVAGLVEQRQQLDRLRAELAETRAAAGHLHDGANELLSLTAESALPRSMRAAWTRLAAEVQAWQSLVRSRSVRGDAPTEGPRVGADAAAELEPVLREEGLTAAADAMRARAAAARADGQPPAKPNPLRTREDWRRAAREDAEAALQETLARSTYRTDGQPPADGYVSESSGEPYGPGTVVDVIADEINTTFGMDLSWPKISGTAHRAAARLRREGHLTDGQPKTGADLADQRRRERETGTGPFRDDPLSTAERMGAAPAEHPRERAIEPIKIRLESACYCENQPSAREIVDAIRAAELDIVAASADDAMAEKREHLRTLDDVFAVRAALLEVCERAEREGRDVRTADVRAVLAAPADDTAAPEDRITAVRELLNAICDPMDQAEAESHLDILGVTRAEVDEAKRRTAARPVRDSPTPTSGEEPTDA